MFAFETQCEIYVSRIFGLPLCRWMEAQPALLPTAPTIGLVEAAAGNEPLSSKTGDLPIPANRSARPARRRAISLRTGSPICSLLPPKGRHGLV